ncbi:tyrosine-protein phosphatase [Actinomadura sp. LOL_016]|uniref:fused DSP-PTPase phosphatase/NAD kinase-like protein n=1 Tax=unclassified Actinomadura TaxID=2626254 RepID=UPI003A7FF6DD
MKTRRVLGWTVAGYAAAWLGTGTAMLLLSERARAGVHRVPAPGVAKFARVDARVWRGAAPTAEGYRWLRAEGVRTIVDLRAEVPAPPARTGDPPPDDAPDRRTAPSAGGARAADAGGAGLRVVRIPVRDGQVPDPGQVRRFLDVVEDARRPVFVHCGAGVGRTGSMVAAYLVGTGRTYAAAATARSLAFGPPTLEQFAFMRGLDVPAARRPARAVVVFSRIADSPRRARARLRDRRRGLPAGM